MTRPAIREAGAVGQTAVSSAAAGRIGELERVPASLIAADLARVSRELYPSLTAILRERYSRPSTRLERAA